ncbi:MAG: N-acetyl-alpha-D-glucosaminyl L-malate synthase BshA [Candidatus Reconcilbacillus cellulovorans]|uniref:N-acetyl-alpha-D-glucosaminyl L-malate synthase BshA n=1 Tax=Candidatus Reconcilbacillus cellulovorans TaxID=1906605 RepID=A0A2A6E427_9BACL|nr:MAG: N-acetyl-alpha-D-glucosaminyl L-malate synthase BshA [Candidatus Reconcilbacillus cellulovorans]
MPETFRIGITCYPTLGGSGVVATELGKLLAEKGHEVHFITYSLPFRLGSFYKNIYYHEVEICDYYVFKYPPYDLSLASKMAQVAQMRGLDLLHVHYAVPHALCALLAREIVGGGLKVVTTLHGTDITILGQDPSLSDLIRYAIDRSDAVTAVSDDLIRQTRLTLGVSRSIDRIYNFVDSRVYYPHDVALWRREFAEPHEAVLLHISNFRPVKRATDVVDIFEKVNAVMPARLVLAGEGPELSVVCSLIRERGLEDRVLYLGKRDDVAQVLSLADVLLLPSEKESFGLVALEAMACGVPTVGSRTGGLPEVVVHGETGFLAPVGDTDAMASYVIRLLEDRDLYRRMSRKAIDVARSRFCGERVAIQYENVYRRILGLDLLPEPEC